MRVVRHADAASFLAAAESFLVEREAFHNLPLGIARTAINNPTRYPGPNYFAVVEDGGHLRGVALMTPPHQLQIYVPPGPAVTAVADDVAGPFPRLPGVVGPLGVAEEFASLWCARHGLGSRTKMELRGFELTEVTAAPPTSGAMRPATDADQSIVASWYRAFHEDAGLGPSNIPIEQVAGRALRDGRVFLWDDGGPVAQTAIVGGTPNGARIGAVYTPGDRRRRGYATALVEAVSRRVLADGKKFCFLFTDLANPVSNSIYPKVGYRPCGDFRDIEFVAAR